MDAYKADRLGLVLAYWALALHLGRPLVSQTDIDFAGDKSTYGSLLNHITVGRHERGEAVLRRPVLAPRQIWRRQWPAAAALHRRRGAAGGDAPLSACFGIPI